jgi:RNA polymerase sigma-54 factor
MADALVAQLEAHRGPVPPLATELVRQLDQFRLVGASAPDRMAASLGVSTGEVAAAVRWLRAELRPPSLPLRERASATRPPDVVVTLTPSGELVVQVLTSLDGVTLDEEWVRLAATAEVDASIRAELQARIAEARMFLALLAERAGVLHRVAETVVALQREAVLHGVARLQDLTRDEVAREIGVHPSTVSRAVTDKVLLLPDRRLVPLAGYFGVGLAARACLVDVLAGREPLSDAAAAAELARRGHPVARRTVAKYRAELGIPAAGRSH